MTTKKVIYGILALYLAYRFGTSRTTPGELIETKIGKVQGIQSQSRDGREFYEWRGIPYAEPPVGDLRYQTPRPAKEWAGIRDGSSYNSVCAQIDLFSKKPMGVEDCLHLSIATPKKGFHDSRNGKGLLPVMVWIHGGYFTCGSMNEYSPTYFMDENVVLVKLNYRLGALGFLSTQDYNARGNMGLKDQAMAIKWVKDNIEAFGGNPQSITVFGESAGGASVHFQLLHKKNKGIITRAISQSGVANSPFALYHDPVGQSKDYAKSLGCPTTKTDVMVECLKGKDVKDLLKGHEAIATTSKRKRDIFVPIVEKINDNEAFLTESVNQVYKNGNAVPVPWLVGTTTEEGLYFIADFLKNETNVKEAQKDFHLLERNFFIFTEHDPVVASKIKKFFFGNDGPVDMSKPETQKAMLYAVSDKIFASPTYDAIQLHADKSSPVYPYFYGKKGGPTIMMILDIFTGKYPPMIDIGLYFAKELWNKYVLPKPEKPSMGVSHADEVFMQFNYGNLAPIDKSSPHYSFSKKFIRSWVQFANGEQPDVQGVQFPLVESSKDVKYMFIDDQPKVTTYPYMEQRNFWKSLNL